MVPHYPDIQNPDIECPVIEAGHPDIKSPVIKCPDIESLVLYALTAILEKVGISRNPDIESSGYRYMLFVALISGYFCM